MCIGRCQPRRRLTRFSPLLVVGGGSRGASAAVARLAERLHAPVVNTVAGKGVFPDAHPLSAGQVMKRKAVQDRVAQRDLVIAIGTELAPTDTNLDELPLGGGLIRIDLDTGKLPGPYADAICLRADAADALDALLAELDGPAGAGGEATGRTRELGAAETRELRELAEAAAPPYRAWHRQVLDALFAGLEGDELIFSDMTQLAYTATQIVPLEPPQRWNHPTGFGTLGYGLPAGVGAAIGAPDRRTVVLAGDGGVMYTVAELVTAVEQGADLLLVVWNNLALGQIRDDMDARGIPQRDVAPQAPDFAALAAALGARVAEPGTLAEITSAVRESAGVATVVVLDERRLMEDPESVAPIRPAGGKDEAER